MRKKIFFTALIILWVFFIFLYTGNTDNPFSSLKIYAETITKKCSVEKYRPTCYDKEIPKLMDRGLSMEDAFAVTKIIQEKDDSYFYCHVLGHKLSAKETAKDPEKWKEVIARVPSGMCSNGGIHGAFQERFRTDSLSGKEIEELEPILSDICDKREGWNPTRLEQATCTHALGHLAMYVTGGDMQKSIALCGRVAFNKEGHDFRQICFDGAFMQIFQPLEPEDLDLVEGKQPTLETLDEYCKPFDGAAYGSCRGESWPLFGKKIKTGEEIVAICSPIQDENLETRCYSGLFYVLAAQLQLNERRIEGICQRLSQNLKNQCFANSASRMIETDWEKIKSAVSLCRRAEEHGAGEACYRELILYSTYNFHPQSDEFFKLCESLPESWKESCLNRS